MEFASDIRTPRELSPDLVDPWYTGDFEIAYQNLSKACRGILASLKK